MKAQHPIAKELIAYTIGGFLGGFFYGILSSQSITFSLLYGLIGAISLTLAKVSIYKLQKNMLKSLTFGIVLGLSISCISFFLLNPGKSFFHFTIPITFGCIVGGSLYIYLLNQHSQNKIDATSEKP